MLTEKRLQWFGHWKQWKRILDLVNVEIPGLMVVSLRDDLENHGMRESERKVSKDIAKDRNAWKSFIGNRPPNHVRMENRR